MVIFDQCKKCNPGLISLGFLTRIGKRQHAASAFPSFFGDDFFVAASECPGKYIRRIRFI